MWLSTCRKRRPSDLYLRDLTQSSTDSMPLQKTALETLYDDDEILDTAQTMPWFDPKYLADNVSKVYQ